MRARARGRGRPDPNGRFRTAVRKSNRRSSSAEDLPEQEPDDAAVEERAAEDREADREREEDRGRAADERERPEGGIADRRDALGRGAGEIGGARQDEPARGLGKEADREDERREDAHRRAHR